MQRPVERFAINVPEPGWVAKQTDNSTTVVSRIVAAIAFAVLGYVCLRWLPGHPLTRDIASLSWIVRLNGGIDAARIAEFASIACFMIAVALVLPPGPLKTVIAAPVAVLAFGALIWLQAPSASSASHPAYFAAIDDNLASIEPAGGPMTEGPSQAVQALALQRDARGMLHANGSLAGREVTIGIRPDSPFSSIGRTMLASLGHVAPANVTHLTVDRLTIGETVLADARLAIVDEHPGLTIGQDLLGQSDDLDRQIATIESIWQQ